MTLSIAIPKQRMKLIKSHNYKVWEGGNPDWRSTNFSIIITVANELTR